MSLKPLDRPGNYFLVWCLLIFALPLTRTVAAQTPAPTSEIDLQPILAHDKLERDQDLTLHVFISNKSTLPITLNDVMVTSEATLEKPRKFTFPIELPALSSTHEEITPHTLNNVKFGGHKVTITADYVWANATQETSNTVVCCPKLAGSSKKRPKVFPRGAKV